MTGIPQFIARARALFRLDPKSPRIREDLIALMNGLPPDDSSARRLASKGSGWQTEDLCTTSDFSVSLFMIPRGHAIPFHDHPSMSVLMRALSGHLEVQAYDWTQRHAWGGLGRHTYTVSMNVLTDTLAVERDHGNIHQVVARDDCVFVDFAFPPYSDQPGRRCAFYRVDGEQIVDDERPTRFLAIERPDNDDVPRRSGTASDM